MALFFIGVGLFLIFIGWFVYSKKQYDLIAGYGHLEPAEKAKVDVKGLALFIRNCFAWMGGLIILAGLLQVVFDIKHLSPIGATVIVVVGTIWLIKQSRCYNLK